jgi:hypothetical protein
MKLSIQIGSQAGQVECGEAAAQASLARRQDARDLVDSDSENLSLRRDEQDAEATASDGFWTLARLSALVARFGSRAAGGKISREDDDAVSVRQSVLEALILVTPASIGVLSDPFRNINNNPTGISLGGGSSGRGTGGVNTGLSGTGTSIPVTKNMIDRSYRISDVINANSLTAAVVGVVSVAVANTVASSSASTTASMSNAFQMIGHAQCESVCVCVCV